MKKEIIIIVGLPGSGKSHLIKDRFSEKEGFVVFDDVQGGAVLDCPNFCFSRHYPIIIAEMFLENKNVVISDISFCDPTKLFETKEILTWWIETRHLNYEIRSVFFENSPEKCKSNIKIANGENSPARLRMIDKLTHLYNPNLMKKEGDEVIVIYSP